MKGTFHTTTRGVAMLGLAAMLAGIGIPAASAGGSYTSSIVASRLGSPDPRDAAALNHRSAEIGSDSYSNARVLRASSNPASASAGLVAGRLGSPDPRDTARLAG